MKKCLFLILGLLAMVAPLSAAWTVDYTEPLSDNNRVIYEMNVYDFTPQGTFAAAELHIC